MAGEGLFFTGQVLKNNRDLLAEEAAREQLKLQKEQLELQKENAAAQRRENRRKNQPSPLSFDSSSMGPEMGKIFQNDVLSYQKNLSGMSDAIINQDPEAINKRYDNESELKTEKVVFDEVWKEVSANRQIARGGNRDSLGTNEEGGYVFEDNYQSFLKAVGQGTNPSEALEMYPIRKGAIKETKFENPANALYATEASNREYKEEVKGYEVNFISKAQFDRVGKKIISKLTPDKNGDWDDPSYKKMYLGQEGLFTVDNIGDLSGPEAFAVESEDIVLDPKDTTFTDKLNPNSETYDAELSNKYIQYLKDKMESEARKNYPGVRGSAVRKPGDKFKGLQSESDWEKMNDSQEFTEQTYGAHGKMLEEYKLSQPPKKVTLTNTLIDTLEVSDRTLGIDTDTARKLIRQLDQEEIDLGQVMINESKDKMYGIFEITIPADLYKQGGSPTIEFSVPLDQIDEKNFGSSVKRWYDSFKNKSVYGEEIEKTTDDSTTPKGVGAKYNT